MVTRYLDRHGPHPSTLTTIADYLYSQNVPFGFQVVPYYTDPRGYYNNGVPETLRLRDSPSLVTALKYLTSKGGVMIEHGYSHQYSNIVNPYTGVTGDDAEFYRLTMNPDGSLNYLGPLPGDSASWATGRVAAAASEFTSAGLTPPAIFTFPAYLASAVDLTAISQLFATRAERSLYYFGLLSGTIDNTRSVGQYFPYAVRDLYSAKVLPDTLGGISPGQFYNYPPRLPADIIADAQRTLVVRDGFASFFYNPSDAISYLQATVTGLKGLGYTFVSPAAV